MERPLRPAGRLPRPARRPLVRLRATHQGPYRAREGATRGACRHVDYVLTRVKSLYMIKPDTKRAISALFRSVLIVFRAYRGQKWRAAKVDFKIFKNTPKGGQFH